MASIDISMVAVAFPHLMRDLGTNLPWAAWTMSVYQLAMTIVMPLAGKLSDSLGHRRIFLFSMVLFTASSMLCGFAPNIYGLIVFRFFQGIGAGSFLPTAAGIVSELFPKNRQSSIGLLTSIFPIGGIVGPNLGGWIVEQYSWRYVFYINIPIGIFLLLLSGFYLEHSPKPYAPPRIDVRGASIFIGGILFLMLGFNGIAEHSSLFSLLSGMTLLVVALVLIALFLRFENRASHPILDVTLLRSRPFLAANLYNLIQGSTFFGVFSFIPLYAISVYQLSTFGSGMILTPRSLGVIVASAITSFHLKRWGYRWPMLLGLAVVSIITLVLGQGPQLWGNMDRVVGKTNILAFLILISGIGVGITMPASNNACIELMPDKVAAITGLRGMFRSIGGIFGVSVITMILHLSSTPALGFKIAFTSFGLWLCMTVPLVFLMPDGREQRAD
jgi:EmrB/QacA subfamily drug resistance transporter